MSITFYKYQGTGNDFILVDDRENKLRNYSHQVVQQLCSRRWGIGADGFILLRNHKPYDFEMSYHNADGSQSLCGNGSRCAVHLAQQLGIIDQKARFIAIDGLHQAFIEKNLVHVQLRKVVEIKKLSNDYWVNLGSPHYVQWVKDGELLDVCKIGSNIRNSPPFQEQGVNVNFVWLGKDNMLHVRTYERGIEDETLSCGTGVVAAALVASLQKSYSSPVKIVTQGGELQVSFKKKGDQQFDEIYLTGPVQQVFQGTIDLDQVVANGSIANKKISTPTVWPPYKKQKLHD